MQLFVQTFTRNFLSEKSRLTTYAAGIEQLPVANVAASYAGFVLDSTDTGAPQLRCPWCNLEVTPLHNFHPPLAWHRTLSRSCPFLQSNKDNNSSFLDTGVLTDNSARFNWLLSTTPAEAQEVITARPADSDVYIQGVAASTDSDEPPETLSEGSLSSSVLQEYKKQNTLGYTVPASHMADIQTPPTRLSEQSDVFYETYRRITFADWSHEDSVSAASLAASGFICFPDGETVECAYCKIQINTWADKSLTADQMHWRKSPSCKFIRGAKELTNIPDVLSHLLADESPSSNIQITAELGIIVDIVKCPEFAVPSRRQETFITWPADNKKMASEMVEHMLYYTGKGDTVCCFSCGSEMSGWAALDNVWVRHIRTAPHCQLVIQEKGQDYVDEVISELGRYVEPEEEPTINTVTTRMLRPRMDSPATQAVLGLNIGVRREELRNALIRNIKFGKRDFNTATGLITSIIKHNEEKRELQRVEAENRVEVPPLVVVHPPQLPSQADTTSEVIEDQSANGTVAISGTITTEEPANEEMETSLTESRPVTPETVSMTPVGEPSVPMENLISLGRSIKVQLACKICLDDIVGIGFLPCGHLVCCAACAPAMVQCPLCRQDVRGTVRAYFNKL